MANQRFDGCERNITFGGIDEDEIQRAWWKTVDDWVETRWVLVVADNRFGFWRAFQRCQPLVQDFSHAGACIDEKCLCQRHESRIPNDGERRSIHLGAVFASDATSRAAAYFKIIQSIPLLLHPAGEDSEVLNKPVDLVVRPLSHRADWEPVQHGCEPCAKTVIVSFVTRFTVEICA